MTAAVLALAVLPAPAPADVAVTYRFSDPAVEETGDGFSRIVFPATMQAGRPGEPTFPFRGAAVLLPPGEAALSVRIERRSWKSIPRAIRLLPRQAPLPGSMDLQGAGLPAAGPALPDGRYLFREKVYAENRWIHPPDPPFRTRYMRGHAILTGGFSPAGHNPATGEAGYYSEVEIVVETGSTAESAEASRLLRTDPATLARLAALVDNATSLPAAGAAAADGDGYDYLIITRDRYADDIAPLRDFYSRRGLRASIMTVEDIYLSYSGLDPAEEIRMAVTEAYTGDGITYVLLAGDSDGGPYDLPHRGLYCAVQSYSLFEDAGIPADLYFGALDGDWNTDGDTLWGEVGEADLYSEVSVGRITFDDEAEAAAVIAKIMMYQESPVVLQCDDALMLGEHLYSDPLTYGGDEMDQLIGAWSIHGFTTSGIPPSFDIVKMYDRDATPWEKADVYARLNGGTGIVCHAGHSSFGYAMRMSVVDITTANFTNDGITAGFPVINSYGCNAGGYDYEDCIAEEMLSLAGCASAYVGNSRYGWFHEGTTNGPSHHFQREFFDAIFTEGITTLGGANTRSRDETVPFLDLPDEYEPGAHRWCFYCLNLLGDPAMDVWTGQPSAIAVSHEPGIARDAEVFNLSTDAPGSTGALFEDNVCYGSGAAGPGGAMAISLLDTIPASADSLDLTVTAHDRLVYRSRIAATDVTATEEETPRLALLQNTPNPFNPVTVIRFTLSRLGRVDIRAYDIAGREVDVIASGEMEAGIHEIEWDAGSLSSGVYLYVLKAEGQSVGRKAVLLR
jgi:hypothetical protein